MSKQQKDFDAKAKKFYILYEEFFKKCLMESFVPRPKLGITEEGITPYINFSIVSNKEKEEILKSMSNILTQE